VHTPFYLELILQSAFSQRHKSTALIQARDNFSQFYNLVTSEPMISALP